MEKQNIYIQKIFSCKEVRFLITLGIIREEELIQDICFIHKIKMSYRLNEKKNVDNNDMNVSDNKKEEEVSKNE